MKVSDEGEETGEDDENSERTKRTMFAIKFLCASFSLETFREEYTFSSTPNVGSCKSLPFIYEKESTIPVSEVITL